MRGATLLTRIIKCNYNWKFPFLRPTIEEVVDERYSAKWPGGSKGQSWGGSVGLLLRLQARTVGEAAAAADPVEAAAADTDGAGAESRAEK